MAKKSTPIPDAWDDDWESQADKIEDLGTGTEEPKKLSKAERLAQHAELNRQIWESAYVRTKLLVALLICVISETPETFHFLAAGDTVPLKTEFKPTLKVLTRKPVPNLIARQDPVTGLSKLTVEDDEDEAGDLKKGLPTAEE